MTGEAWVFTPDTGEVEDRAVELVERRMMQDAVRRRADEIQAAMVSADASDDRLRSRTRVWRSGLDRDGNVRADVDADGAGRGDDLEDSVSGVGLNDFLKSRVHLFGGGRDLGERPAVVVNVYCHSPIVGGDS